MGRDATAVDEEAVFFEAEGNELFGILTNPTAPPRNIAVIFLAGGATPITPNRNRLSVRLNRSLASMGYHAFRFDYHGAGESTGSVEHVDLAHPHVADLIGAVTWLGTRGIDRVILVGTCLGSRTALAAAPRIQGLEAMIFLSLPLQDMTTGERSAITASQRWTLGRYARRTFRLKTLRDLFDRRKRTIYKRYARELLRASWRGHRSGDRADVPRYATRSVLEPLSDLARRRIPTLLIYGDHDGYYEEFLEDRDSPTLDRLFREAGPSFEVRVLPGQVHGFTTVHVQDRVIQELCAWFARSELRIAEEITK